MPDRKVKHSDMITITDRECPVCGQKEPLVFFKAASVPIFCNVYLPSPEKAKKAPTASIRLGFCTKCSLIYNYDFNDSFLKYDQNYENSLNFSGCFQSYTTQLAKELVERYHLFGKQIIEIGCGQADFLSLLCQLGNNHGIGFDPAYNPKKIGHSLNTLINIIPEYYSELYKDIPADFICSSYVFEHINDPVRFLSIIRNAIGDKKETVVFFEVPNALYTIRDYGIWDIIYEHCCYFSSCSLENAFRKTGFKPLNTSTGYEGQSLRIEAVPGTFENQDPIRSDEINLLSWIENFSDFYKTKVEFWKETLLKLGQRVVLWGAGSKGVSFLNTLKVEIDVIEYAVDINPRKWGFYIPGTGQKIVKPEFLQDYNTDIVLVMNPIYKDEIKKMMQDLGIGAKIFLV